MKTLMSSAAILVVAAAGSANAATELVLNGGFEGPLAGSWVASGSPIQSGRTTSDPFEGARAYRFGSIIADHTITQSIATIAGRTYRFSFMLRNTTGFLERFRARFGATTVLSLIDPLLDPPTFNTVPSFPYTKFSYLVTATGSSTAVSFSGRHVLNGGWRLDNVSVSVVPEPSTWMMMILGFGLIARRLRQGARGAVSAAA
jgi:hypothetical protein